MIHDIDGSDPAGPSGGGPALTISVALVLIAVLAFVMLASSHPGHYSVSAVQPPPVPSAIPSADGVGVVRRPAALLCTPPEDWLPGLVLIDGKQVAPEGAATFGWLRVSPLSVVAVTRVSSCFSPVWPEDVPQHLAP